MAASKIHIESRIPPEFNTYAEKKGVFSLLQALLNELLISLPQDPLEFLIDIVSRKEVNVPKITVCGAPVAGKRTIGRRVAQKLRCVFVDAAVLLEEEDESKEVAQCKKEGKPVSPVLWADLIAARLSKTDCINKGWVLVGFPSTREEALALQATGVAMAKHCVHLEAPDSVLLERHMGKRVDPITGDVYHTTFAMPSSAEVASRLVQEEGGPTQLKHRLREYRRHMEGLVSCYLYKYRLFDADQPIDDLSLQVMSFLGTSERSAAPITPRVVLLGPTGSGKSTMAVHLTDRYGLVDVDCGRMLRQVLQSKSPLADLMRPFHERGMSIPDDMVLQALESRLTQVDCATKGWVLHGYPRTRDQAELLAKAGLAPNRVYFFDVPVDTVLERLALRRVDPVTGKRYHLLFDPPPDQETKERLKQHPCDSEEKVRARVEQYQQLLDDLLDYYEAGQHINTDQDPQLVFENVESVLVNPLPKQL